MVVGVIARDSVVPAFVDGITAAQIIHFLEANAHPEMRSRTPLIPMTVTDQIRVWERERNRMAFAEAALFEDFQSAREFELLRAYARDTLKCELACNVADRTLVVTAASLDTLREYYGREVKAAIANDHDEPFGEPEAEEDDIRDFLSFGQ